MLVFFFFQAEDGIRDKLVTGVQTCALPIWSRRGAAHRLQRRRRLPRRRRLIPRRRASPRAADRRGRTEAPMDLQVAGRVVIVTGGASGIGRATAGHFQREGARLVLADLQPAALATAVAELRAAGGEVESEAVDVRDYAACERLVARTVDAFGRVDMLVNSAG